MQKIIIITLQSIKFDDDFFLRILPLIAVGTLPYATGIRIAELFTNLVVKSLVYYETMWLDLDPKI